MLLQSLTIFRFHLMYHQRFAGRPDGGSRGPRFGGRPFNFGGCSHPSRHQAGTRLVPVNIESTTDSFMLTLFAAGLSKEKIQLSVQGEVLTIAYPGTTPVANDVSYTHQEFRDLAFERNFQLSGKVLVESIKASYDDGILTVTLPKDPAANPPAQTIAVG